MTKLEKSVHSKGFEIESRIATSTQSIKSIKIVTSDFRHHESTITTSSSSNKVVDKRSKRDLVIKTSFTKKTCQEEEIDVMIKFFFSNDSFLNYNKTQYTKNCVVLLYIMQIRERELKTLDFWQVITKQDINIAIEIYKMLFVAKKSQFKEETRNALDFFLDKARFRDFIKRVRNDFKNT